MFNKRIIERLVIVFCLFLFPAVAVSNAEDLFSFEKDTGRTLLCPPLEGTIDDPIPGGFDSGEILDDGDGRFYSTCRYFRKTGDTSWESVASVTVHWIEKKGAQEVDCKWDDKNDPDKYIVSKDKQAYAGFSIGAEDMQAVRKVAAVLLAQAEMLALACPKKQHVE